MPVIFPLSSLSLVLASTIFAPNIAFSESIQVEQVFKEKGEVDFYASIRSGLFKVHGTNDQLTGTLSQSSEGLQGAFSIPMIQFTTGSKMRDRHLNTKIFQSDQFSDGSMTLSPIVLTGKNYEGPFNGKLKFHGLEKDIFGLVKIQMKENGLVHHASFTIKLSDFNIPLPEFAGIKVLDEVKVEVDGRAAL